MTRQWPLSLKLGKDDIVNYFVGFGHGQDPEPGQGHGERGHGTEGLRTLDTTGPLVYLSIYLIYSILSCQHLS